MNKNGNYSVPRERTPQTQKRMAKKLPFKNLLPNLTLSEMLPSLLFLLNTEAANVQQVEQFFSFHIAQ